jgi:hypothetical protein
MPWKAAACGIKGPRWGMNKSPAGARYWRGGPCCRLCWPSLYMSAISCSSSRALCSLSRIIWRTLACTVTRWRLASRMSFCFWRLRFLMCRACSCSCSSAQKLMTSPSSVASLPSGGAKPGVVLVVVLRSYRCVGCLREWVGRLHRLLGGVVCEGLALFLG